MQESLNIDGTIYVLSPLNKLKDIKELAWYTQYGEYLALRKNPDVPKAEVEKAYVRCSERTVSPDDIDKTVAGMEGGSYMLWLSMKKTKPDITVDQIQELLTPALLAEGLAKVMDISGFQYVKKNLLDEVTAANQSTLTASIELMPNDSSGHPTK